MQPALPTQPDTPEQPDLKRAVTGGVAWAYASYALSKLLVFGTTVILARLLAPEDFGIVGFALAVIGYLSVARDLGVGAALITRPQVDRRMCSTAFWTSLAWGLVLCLAVVLGAPLVGLFFDERAVLVTRVLGVGFFLSTLGSTHDALLYRGLAFNRRIVPDVIQSLVKGVVSITLALVGWGYWSLVVGQLAGQASFCVAAWIMQPFRPRFEWDPAAGRWLLGFGSSIVISDLVVAILPNMGALVVGGELGATALGVFTIGQRIPELVLLNSFAIISTVLFPVYARLQHDHAGLQQGYLLAQRYLSLFSLPVGVGMAVVAPLFVRVFYGDRWGDAAIIMQLFALRYAVGAVGWHAGDIAKATGHGWLQVIIVVIPLLILGPFVFPITRAYGLVGLSVAYLAAGVLAAGLKTILIRRVVKVPLMDAIAALGPGSLAAVCVAVATGLALSLGQGLPGVVDLAGAVLCGGIAYALALLFTAGDLIRAVVPQKLAVRFVRPSTPVLNRVP